MTSNFKYFSATSATPTIGAYISDINLAIKNPPEAFDELRQALAKNKVIFFRDQEMSDEKFHTLGQNFGSLEIHEFFPHLAEYPEIQIISTKGGNTGTDRWHTDVTFRETPSSASILRAIDIPPEGGDTMWLCTNAAFLDLSEPISDLLLKLTAIHDMRYGMTGYVNQETVEKEVKATPPTQSSSGYCPPHYGQSASVYQLDLDVSVRRFKFRRKPLTLVDAV